MRLKSWAGKVMKRITPRVMAPPTRVWTGEPKAWAGVASADEKVDTSGLTAAARGVGGAAQGRLVKTGKLAPTGTASRPRFSAPVDWPAPAAQTQPSGLTSVPDTTVARQPPAASSAARSTVSVRTSCCRLDGGGQGGIPGPP